MRRIAGCAVVLVVSLCIAGCGDDQNPWCEDLESLGDLTLLSSAIVSGDATQARGELDEFSSIAASAPDEVRTEMEQIARVLDEVVAIGLVDGGTTDDELEQRRDRANQELAEMSDSTAVVAAWAEENCGIRLD